MSKVMSKVLRARAEKDNEALFEVIMRGIVDDYFKSAKAQASEAEKEIHLEANESLSFDEPRLAVRG